MSDSKISTFLLLKYGSFDHAFDLWLDDEIKLSYEEREVLAEGLDMTLDEVIGEKATLRYIEEHVRDRYGT